MNNAYYYRGLLWKELRENARLFVLAFILISWENLLYPVISWLLMRGETFEKWSSSLLAMMDPNASGTSFMVQIGIIISVALGVLMLSHERSGSLEYLISTPVKREEIIISKFISGSLALAGIMFINAAVIVLVLTIGPTVAVTKTMVMGWFFSLTIAWVCLFALGLMASTLCRNFVVAGFAVLFVVTLPGIITQFACQVVTHFFDASGKLALKIFNNMRHVDLWSILAMKTPAKADSVDATSSFYIATGYSRNWVDTPDYFIMNSEVLVHLLELSILTGIFLAVAVWLFNRNPLERKDDWLVFGYFKHVTIIILTFSIAWQQGLNHAGSLLQFIGYFVLFFVLIYLMFIVLNRFLSFFRLREWMGK
ncbi:MAG: ABC transporter permease subunit [Syntrophomonadaceae bacterium]|nr:ABC transporter permease subunit [Syntrophomonadaceae bacterium]